MTDTNYIGSIVKILETPKQKLLENNILMTELRVQFPQFRNTRIINLKFWGNLARDVANYYEVNDYILIEGYVSVSKRKALKKIQIVVLKAYPFLLSYDRSTNKN